MGANGSSETVTIDHSGGEFSPGATDEPGLSEIEIAVNLGDAMDRVIIVGTAGDDDVAVGTSGVASNADGDVDVTFAPLRRRSRSGAAREGTRSPARGRKAPAGGSSGGCSSTRATKGTR